MNPYEVWLTDTKFSSYKDLYWAVQSIAKVKLGLDVVPFPLSALENPPDIYQCPEICSFMAQCFKAFVGNNSDSNAIKLIQFLKHNPPNESFANPILPDSEPTQDEKDLILHIWAYGIDLPGSKYNPFGHLQYYSSFFIDMFFGNYTEYNDYVKSLSREQLMKAMTRREGYCQFSPIFAPILGLRMVNIETKLMFTNQEEQEIRKMYTGCNENKHLKIVKKLIKLGADVNAHDINGFTPLHYAIINQRKDITSVLLNHGANPNSESRNGFRPLTVLSYIVSQTILEFGTNVINDLIKHGAKLTNKSDINMLRNHVELFCSKELVLRVREVHPREKEECEKCSKPAPRKLCGACGLVSYCTPACQKLDWKFHKITCKKKQAK